MDEIGRVGVGEGLRDLIRQVERAARIERPPVDKALQRLALNELVHEIQPAGVLAHVVQRHDVLVRHGGSEVGVPEKTRTPLRVRNDPIG